MGRGTPLLSLRPPAAKPALHPWMGKRVTAGCQKGRRSARARLQPLVHRQDATRIPRPGPGLRWLSGQITLTVPDLLPRRRRAGLFVQPRHGTDDVLRHGEEPERVVVHDDELRGP